MGRRTFTPEFKHDAARFVKERGAAVQACKGAQVDHGARVIPGKVHRASQVGRAWLGQHDGAPAATRRPQLRMVTVSAEA